MNFSTATTTFLAKWMLQAVAVVTLLSPVAGQTAEVCDAAGTSGARSCKAGLTTAQIQNIVAIQEKSQWCWAASIAMIFAHYGFTLPQERIVRQHFGDTADRPVAAGAITDLLDRSWKDAQGRPFMVTATVADAPDTRPRPALNTMVTELAGDRPLVIGVTGHAMVLVRVEYDRLPTGELRITGGTVIDPTPGKGLRRLTSQESRPTYLAAVHVLEAQSVASAHVAPAAAL